MPILKQDEYSEIYEAVQENRDTLEKLVEGKVILEEGEKPDPIEMLNDAGAAAYRSGEEDGEFYATASSLGQIALEHIENGGTLEQYLTAMRHIEEDFKEIYR